MPCSSLLSIQTVFQSVINTYTELCLLILCQKILKKLAVDSGMRHRQTIVAGAQVSLSQSLLYHEHWWRRQSTTTQDMIIDIVLQFLSLFFLEILATPFLEFYWVLLHLLEAILLQGGESIRRLYGKACFRQILITQFGFEVEGWHLTQR